MGGPDRTAARAPAAGGRPLDPGARRRRIAQLATRTAVTAHRSAVPHPRPRVRRPQRRADLGDLLRRAAGARRCRWSSSPATGRTASSSARPSVGDHRRGHGRGRRRAPRPDGDAALHRLPRRRLLAALDRDRQAGPPPGRRRSSWSTGSAGARTAGSCGRASARTARAQVGRRAHRGHAAAVDTPDRPRSGAGVLTPTGWPRPAGAGGGPGRRRRRSGRPRCR